MRKWKDILKMKPYFFHYGKGWVGLNFYDCGSPRYWVKDENKDTCTHFLRLKKTPDYPEAIGCNAFECGTEDEALAKCRKALEDMQYGNFYWYVNQHGHSFGYAVHYPRFESEGTGFINFHCINFVTKREDIPFKED